MKFSNNNKKASNFPPTPKWKPNLPIDLNLIMEKARYYTAEKLQIAVFEFGTVVIFPERVSSIHSSAIQVLSTIYNSHPDFNPKEMDDGNYIIEYTRPAFTIIFKNEIEEYWDYIEKNHLYGLCANEVLINEKGEHNVFDKIGKISLFGRSKMFMDAQNPKIILAFGG